MRNLLHLAPLLLLATPVLAQPTWPVQLQLNGYAGRLIVNGAEANTYPVDPTLYVLEGVNFVETGAAICMDDARFCSYIVVTVDGAGRVTSLLPAASGVIAPDGLSFALNTAQVRIDPKAYTGDYYLSTLAPGTAWHGPHNVTLIKGLTYGIDNGVALLGTLHAGGTLNNVPSDLHFKLNSAEMVVLQDPLLGPAIGTRRKVTFVTSKVRVLPEEVEAPHTVVLSSAPFTPLPAGEQVMMHGLLSWIQRDGVISYFVP